MPEPKLVEAVAREPEMVRRVAEAITANNGGEWWLWLDEARAAIEKMRRPTPEMVRAAWPNIMHENAEDVWTDMIDAALAAPDEGERL